jgi:hypothetical protein
MCIAIFDQKDINFFPAVIFPFFIIKTLDPELVPDPDLDPPLEKRWIRIGIKSVTCTKHDLQSFLAIPVDTLHQGCGFAFISSGSGSRI